MISSISSSANDLAALYGQSPAGPPKTGKAAAAPEDTAQISAKALAGAGGDADHDGDGH